VVTGTARDSQFLLDRLRNNPTTLNPTEITTDTASASDVNFGLCQLLGYRYMPRLADLPDRRLFRIHAGRDYGCSTRWPGTASTSASSANTGTTSAASRHPAHQSRRALRSHPCHAARRPTHNARARNRQARPDRAHHRHPRLRHPTRSATPDLTQLNRQEARHALARDVFRGQLYQPYRPGQEQQLGALGLVANAIALWDTTYMNLAVEHLTAAGTMPAAADLERLSPLQHEQVNLHGRYSFLLPDYLRTGQLRPLTSPSSRDANPARLLPRPEHRANNECSSEP
jgi:hypothetical protein